jgi:hypothetical protein
VPYSRNASPHGVVGLSPLDRINSFNQDNYNFATQAAYARQVDKAVRQPVRKSCATRVDTATFSTFSIQTMEADYTTSA